MKQAHNRLYDWPAWFASGQFVLHRGREYRCSTASIVGQCRSAASRLGLSISVIPDEVAGRVTVIVHHPVIAAAGS